MKIIHTTKIKSGAMWVDSKSFEMDIANDFESAMLILGFRKLDNGQWYKRTAYDECEVIKIK